MLYQLRETVRLFPCQAGDRSLPRPLWEKPSASFNTVRTVIEYGGACTPSRIYCGTCNSENSEPPFDIPSCKVKILGSRANAR